MKWGTEAFATEALSSTLRRYKIHTRAKTHERKNKKKKIFKAHLFPCPGPQCSDRAASKGQALCNSPGVLSDGHIHTPVPEVPTQPVSTGKDYMSRISITVLCLPQFSVPLHFSDLAMH